MATIETTKKTVEHVEEHEGVQELTNSVTVARQEDAGSSSLRTSPPIPYKPIHLPLLVIQLIAKYSKLTGKQTTTRSPSLTPSRKTRRQFYGVCSSFGQVCLSVSRATLLETLLGFPNSDRISGVYTMENTFLQRNGNRHLQLPPRPRKFNNQNLVYLSLSLLKASYHLTSLLPTYRFAVGALTCGFISDTIGRKYTVMAGLVGSYISVTMEVVANTNGLFFAGKFLNGFVVGMLAAVCPTYLGEIVPLALRGLLTAMIAFAYALAPLTAAVIVNSTGTKTNVWAYRSVFCAQYGFCFISTVFAPFIPESPWWLASKGRDEKALTSLRRLGCNTDIEAVRKLALIKVTLEEVRRETEGVTYFECFRVSNLRRTIISIAPLTIQALGGVIFIAGYFVYYAELAGYSSAAAFKLYVIFQVISMCGNIASWFIIDRVGRRDLTLYGTASLMVILMLAGGLATAGKTPYIKGCFSMMMIYAFVYNCTIGATGYTLLTEIATSRLRVKTIAIGIALQNIIYMVLGFVLPYLFNPNYLNLGAKVRSRISDILFVPTPPP